MTGSFGVRGVGGEKRIEAPGEWGFPRGRCAGPRGEGTGGQRFILYVSSYVERRAIEGGVEGFFATRAGTGRRRSARRAWRTQGADLAGGGRGGGGPGVRILATGSAEEGRR